MKFTASDLAKWSKGIWLGDPPSSFPSISTDTRTIQNGSLFVALRGGNFDGHHFLDEAFARGAGAAVVDQHFVGEGSSLGQAGRGSPLAGSKGPPSPNADRGSATAGPLLQVSETRRALLDIAAGHRASLAMRTVAVTGSAGKTTVKEMTADVLATAAPTVRTRGNFNNDIGVPISVFAADSSHRYGVFEVGMNHPGELAPLCEVIKPSCSIVTAVGPVHLEFFDNEQGIANEKAEVFRALKKSGRAILSRDEKWFDVLRAAAKCRVITTSLIGGADYVAKISGDGSLKFAVTEKTTGDCVEFIAPLPGEFIVHDALLAIAAGRYFKLPWSKIQAAIQNYRAAPMRWQREEHRGVAFINDCYNANPLSMKAALDAFAAMKTPGRKWVVLAGMLELGKTEREEHEAVGRIAASHPFDGVITIGERGGWIADGAIGAKIRRVETIDGAIEIIAEAARDGDTVLLKASRGEKLERVFEAWKKLRQ